jgi:DNA-binding transcriptional LysR family regulator
LYLLMVGFVSVDTRFIETLVTVVECGSIAEAARRLNLTRAAVAQRIHVLESELGARLVVRSGHTVSPTPAAAIILGRARELLGSARDIRSMVAGGTLTGELRLGALQTAQSGLLADIFARFVTAHPQIELRTIRDHPAQLYRKVIDGDVDAAMTVHPPFEIPKSCDWVVLREEPYVVITSAAVPEDDAHAVLAREAFIRLDRKVFSGQLIDCYLREAGIEPKERLELDGLELIVQLVDRGLGVSLLPDWAPPWPEGLSLRKLPLPDRSFRRRTGLLWSRASLRVSLVHAFLEQALLVLGEQGKTPH